MTGAQVILECLKQEGKYHSQVSALLKSFLLENHTRQRDYLSISLTLAALPTRSLK